MCMCMYAYLYMDMDTGGFVPQLSTTIIIIINQH